MTDITTATAIVSAIVAFFAPAITAVLNKPHWSSQAKQIMALGVSLVLAVVAMAVTDGFTGGWYAVILTVVGISQAAYALIWKTSGVAPAIEATVNSSGKHAAADGDPV